VSWATKGARIPHFEPGYHVSYYGEVPGEQDREEHDACCYDRICFYLSVSTLREAVRS